METPTQHTVERNDSDASGEYVSLQQQLRNYVEKHLAKGADVCHLGSSAIGLNARMTDIERRRVLDDLGESLETVYARHDTVQK